MAFINENFLNLKENYLFIDIAKKINAYREANPDKKIIRMGIGDVTRPLAPVVVEAIKKGADELGCAETFRGYEESGRGYLFLREAVSDYYASFGVSVGSDEILISDGAKSDCGNIVDIFSDINTVLVTDPAYPVYVDSNIMSGKEIIYAASTEENGYAAMPDENVDCDIIYLCSPNNPTGSVYTAEQLEVWVEYAQKKGALIIFDAAYEAFVTDKSLPRSILGIKNARRCCIEICSLSKTAGFTGMRCGYTVIPKELNVMTEDGDEVNVLKVWCRRQGSKFNGVSYPVQCGAAAVFTELGQKQTHEAIDYYMENARIMSETCEKLGISYTGGKNSPYIWMKCPDKMTSWEFFDYLLNEIQVVGTPGEGFGPNGAGRFRLTAFGTRENTIEAMKRLTALMIKNVR